MRNNSIASKGSSERANLLPLDQGEQIRSPSDVDNQAQYSVERVHSKKGLASFEEIENLIKTDKTYITVNEQAMHAYPREYVSNLSVETYNPLED